MKKLSFLLSMFVLLTTFSCDNEPLDRDIQILTQLTCEEAVANTTIAALNFVSANENNYANLCSALKTAVEAQIVACGDTDGSLQATIDGLGDCSNNNQDPCATATQAVLIAQIAFNNATTDNYSSLCNAYKAALENQISECGDEDGSIQALIDGLGNCGDETNLCEGNGSDLYFPLAIGNYWKWEYPFSVGGNPDVSAEIIGMFEYDGIEYFELEYTGSNGAYHFQYLRYDASNNLKVLVYYISNTTDNYYEEHLLIPNTTLTNTSQWDFYGVFDNNTASYNYVQDVYNVNLTMATDACEYQGCLEIFTKNTLADPAFPQLGIADYKVYKKGVGIVNFDGNKLTEMILN